MTTVEKTVAKRKSITITDMNKPKRFKSVEDDSSIINNNGNKGDLPSSTHTRIY